MEVPELTDKEFENFIKKGIVLIDFFADWCMPCLMMAPIMEDLSEKFHGKIKFGKINVDDNTNLAQKFNVMSIPNFVLFKEGKILERFVGSMDFDNFVQKLKKAI